MPRNDTIDVLLAQFLKEFWDVNRPLPGDADLFGTLGIDGDDAFEFMAQFGAKFGVDVTEYHWYFHHGEEELSLAALLFKPPYWRVQRIPITPNMLLEAIRTKRWPLQYPEHQLPSVRWDVVFALPATLLAIAVLGLGAAAVGWAVSH